MRASNNIEELAKALAKAQGDFSGVKKGKVNPHFKSTYADLASALDACRDSLSDNGLSIVQLTNSEPGSIDVSIVTRLMHESGQWIESVLNVRATQQTPQGLGSAITYGRRYSLMAMVGIAPEDDDGQAGSNKTPQENNNKPSYQKTQPRPVTKQDQIQTLKKENNLQVASEVQGETFESIRKEIEIEMELANISWNELWKLSGVTLTPESTMEERKKVRDWLVKQNMSQTA